MYEISTNDCSLVAGGRQFTQITHGMTKYDIDDVLWTSTTYDEEILGGPLTWTKRLESDHARFRLEYNCDQTICSWTLSGMHFPSEDEFSYEGKEAKILRDIGTFEGNRKFQEIIDHIWDGATWHVPSPPLNRNYYCNGELVRMPASGISEGWNIRAYPPC
ncbi:hypothetical protein ACFQU1_06365 [Chelatococcus sp. GCM10030263]|uniref:hypothetical protein n=1 Tax=Chelatococcus sp. GCM10030263 TaxID=3273387 RepID=UPI00361C8697